MLNVQESQKTWLPEHYNEWDSLLFYQATVALSLQIEIYNWTEQHLVS